MVAGYCTISFYCVKPLTRLGSVMKVKRFAKTVVAVTEMRVSRSRGHGLVATDVGGGSTIGVLGSPEATKKHMAMRLDQSATHINPYTNYRSIFEFRSYLKFGKVPQAEGVGIGFKIRMP